MALNGDMFEPLAHMNATRTDLGRFRHVATRLGDQRPSTISEQPFHPPSHAAQAFTCLLLAALRRRYIYRRCVITLYYLAK